MEDKKDTFQFSEILIILCFEILIVPQGAKGLPGITVNGLLKYFGDLGGMVTVCLS